MCSKRRRNRKKNQGKTVEIPKGIPGHSKKAFSSCRLSLIAISFNAFVIPYGLLSGGVSGLALLGNYIFNIPVYLGIFLLNIPIFLWGLKELDKKFMAFSAVGTIVLIAVLPLSRPYIPVPELDLFLACIFSGVGSGLAWGSSSGTAPRQGARTLFQ